MCNIAPKKRRPLWFLCFPFNTKKGPQIDPRYHPAPRYHSRAAIMKPKLGTKAISVASSGDASRFGGGWFRQRAGLFRFPLKTSPVCREAHLKCAKLTFKTKKGNIKTPEKEKGLSDTGCCKGLDEKAALIGDHYTYKGKKECLS